MRYLVLVCDYDGTIARHGKVGLATARALEQCRESGRKTILVTGRILEDLQRVCDCLPIFDWVVAENGAVLYCPADGKEIALCDPPPAQFLEALGALGVDNCSVGRVIVATWQPRETAVLHAIRDCGLELQVVFNKGAVMVLPSGINKATGLQAALQQLSMSPHNAVAIGDAENDHALFDHCEACVAVANAVPMLKDRADWTTARHHGRGVREVIEQLIEHDLQVLEPRLTRHHLLVGHRDDESTVTIPPYGQNILVSGSSGSGKSTFATAFLEALVEHKYQFCVIDPEGDHHALANATVIGSMQQPPEIEAIIQLLETPSHNVIVSMVGVSFDDRPKMFLKLLSRLQELRADRGMPHWIIIDEAHHVLPAGWEPIEAALPQTLDRLLLITLSPDLIVQRALKQVDTVIAVGQEARDKLRELSRALRIVPPALPRDDPALEPGEVLVWPVSTPSPPFRMWVVQGATERRRHSRKYAEGELEPERSFFFRGPDSKLNLRAQNLFIFLQIAQGVDDDTWLHHLRLGDYSRWFSEAIKDADLADEASMVEADLRLSAAESRQQIKALIDQRYTLPAS
jgi:HAD superfamily hydrolase (TIGR01484 family)